MTHYPQPESGNAEAKIRPTVEKAQLEKTGNRLGFSLTNVRKPGIYTVSLVTLGDGPEGDRMRETRAYAFNVDAADEGDLKRASTDRLLPELPSGDSKHGKIVLRVPGSSGSKTSRSVSPTPLNRPCCTCSSCSSSWSSRPWPST